MDVVIVGAGLAGLTAADALHAAGRTVTVVEARPSVGGRMKTLVDGAQALDLGATWHWADQPAVRALAAELGIETFVQYRAGQAVIEGRDDGTRRVDVPEPVPAELRVVGGVQQLVHRLAARLPDGAVVLEHDVTDLSAGSAGVTVSMVDAADRERQVSCECVVVAIPPRLAWAGITFSPALPPALADVMQATPTWMANAVKCIAVYESPFWRDAGLSGLAFSQAGPLFEVHDGCSADGSTAALWGFLSPSHDVRDLGVDRRRELVFEQLGRLFGPAAADPVQYLERDWSDDPYTNDAVVWLGDLSALGHPAFSEPRFDGRLVWAGAETSAAGAGHMEGAVRSGQRAAAQVLARLTGGTP